MISQPDADARDVVIQIPADPTFVRVVRLATSGAGTLAGFDVDTIDDIRIAVDEMCATLIELADSHHTIALTMRIQSDSLTITGETETGVDPGGIDAERHALGRMILDAICDHHELSVNDGIARFVIQRRRVDSPPADGI